MNEISDNAQPLLRFGWEEWVALPDLGLPALKAKVDTGARTSSLHAFDLEEVVVGGRDHVSFTIHPWQATDEDAVGLTLPVHDRRSVRSSSGHAEDRIVVLMRLTLARRRITAEVTLTDRRKMRFPMLLGREAMAGRVLVDSEASFLLGRPDHPGAFYE